MLKTYNFDRTPDFEAGEILVIDKPLNWSSFDVVNKIRYKLKIYTGNKKIKVGHAGTLDPLASGVLIICTGKATKLIEEIQVGEKVYEAVFRLGATTPSFDRETEIDKTFDLPEFSNEQIFKVAESFVGRNMQTPPTYSAIQIDGKRAYEYARKGREVTIAQREIFIPEMKISEINLPDVSLTVTCSKGTYIRTLADDFGKRLDNGAFLYYLRRIRSGSFSINEAIELKDFEVFMNNMKPF